MEFPWVHPSVIIIIIGRIRRPAKLSLDLLLKMNFLSQLKVSVGGQVVSVDKVKDTTNVQQYIQCKCAASGREVSMTVL